MYINLIGSEEGPIKLEKSSERHFGIFSEDNLTAEVWIDGFKKTTIKMEFVE